MLRKELGPLLTAFKDAMDGRFPDGIFEAMKRIQRYKRGDRAEDVFGESGRSGYHDDCQLVADYFASQWIK